MVIGTKTRIASVRRFDVDGGAAAIDPVTGMPIAYVGHWRTVLPPGSDRPEGPSALEMEATLPADFLYRAQVTLELSPSIRLIKLPYVSSITSGMTVLQGTMLDDPPMPPEIEMSPYRGVDNQLFFLLNTGMGSKEFEPIAFNSLEQMYILRLQAMSGDPGQDHDFIWKTMILRQLLRFIGLIAIRLLIGTSRDTYAAVIESRDSLIGDKQASSVGFRQPVEPNKKYYFMFRAIDVHGHFSYPTPVYEVMMVNNDGAIYPHIRAVDFASRAQSRTSSRKVNRFLRIRPAFLQRHLSTQEPLEGPPATAPTGRRFTPWVSGRQYLGQEI